ncbi:MAG TPA: DUF4230 domain-containing protein [Terriglobales bacterium]|jgi:hypothetical protein|nr:DUF4230 domain-containing protein [Terriglobales bacterium]
MNTSLPPQDREGFPRPGGKRWGPALALALLLGAGALALLSRQSETPLWSRWFGALAGRGTRLDVSQPTVVEKIQQLQRLETVVYTMDKVVSGGKENVLPDFLTGDRLLMLVHGEVVAGVDFETLKSGDVAVSGKQVRLHLPDAQVFSTRLDNARTKVYSRQTGLLVPVDPNLESQVRQEAERQLLQAALTDGILRTAQGNARSTMTSLLQGLGFWSVEFY